MQTLIPKGKHVGTEVAQTGLGNDNQEKVYHSYYQWVPFTLFFQVSWDITFRHSKQKSMQYNLFTITGMFVLRSSLYLEKHRRRQSRFDLSRYSWYVRFAPEGTCSTSKTSNQLYFGKFANT